MASSKLICDCSLVPSNQHASCPGAVPQTEHVVLDVEYKVYQQTPIGDKPCGLGSPYNGPRIMPMSTATVKRWNAGVVVSVLPDSFLLVAHSTRAHLFSQIYGISSLSGWSLQLQIQRVSSAGSLYPTPRDAPSSATWHYRKDGLHAPTRKVPCTSFMLKR